MEQHMRRHRLIKFLLAGALLTAFVFVEVGGEGKATIFTDQSQKKELAKMYDRPSLVTSSEPITAVQVSQFSLGAPAKPAQHFVEHGKNPKEVHTATHDKKKLGLTLLFLGMVADHD